MNRGRETKGTCGELLRDREQKRQLGNRVGENMDKEKRSEKELMLITVLHHQANTKTFC